MNSKLPPQNIEAEQSLLGSLLIDKDAIVKVAGFLMPGHFYREAHSEIYRSIFALYERREPADLVTVSGELKDRKKLKEIGGDSYLADLVNSVPTAAHVESYANLVKDSHTRRELISTAAEISEKAYGGVKSMGELLDETEQKIFTISQQHLTRHFVPIKETLAESFDRLEELHRKKSHIRGIPTGFRDIDNKLSGLRDGSLIVLAARPSLGKTSLALNIAQYVTVHEKLPVGFFSLESSKEELVDRLLASQSNVDSWKITTGNLNEEDFTKIGEGMGILAEAPLFIDDTPGASIMEMRTKARRLQLEQGLRLLIVDYLQLAVSRNLENRVQEVSEISQGLKNLARELKCPVLAISQLSRAVEARGEKRPQLSDLRESGCLTGDTYIYLLDQGIYRRIDELVGREGFNVPSLNLETWQLEPCQVERAFATGYQAVSRLTTRLGRNLKATGNHKFLTVDGWRRLDELMVGTRIALPRRLDGPSLRTMSDEVRSANTNRDVIPREVWRELVVPQMEFAGLTTRQMQRNLGTAYCGTSLYKSNLSRERALRVAQVVESRELEKLAQSDIYWDEILSIEPAGEAAVYDLTVGGWHNFVANNIIAHNSIEQDSDVVMFLYRPEDAEQREQIKLLISKHRNGPTGELDLIFKGERTRFYGMEKKRA